MKRLVPILRDVWPSSSGAFQMKKSQPFMVSTYSLQLTSAYLTCLHQRWLTNRHQEIIAQGARPDLSDKRSLWSCWDYCWSPQVGPVSWESHHLTLATEKKNKQWHTSGPAPSKNFTSMHIIFEFNTYPMLRVKCTSDFSGFCNTPVLAQPGGRAKPAAHSETLYDI